MNFFRQQFDVEKYLEEYLSFFPEEKTALNLLRNLVEDGDEGHNLFDRKQLRGHITASGFIYDPRNDKTLLLEHKNLKKFLQPGGHIEKSDNSILSAAKREVFEETGLTNLNVIGLSKDINVPFDINSHRIPKNSKKAEGEHYHHDFRYLFVTDGSGGIKINPDESNSYKWIAVSELERTKDFRAVVRKIRALLGNVNG